MCPKDADDEQPTQSSRCKTLGLSASSGMLTLKKPAGSLAGTSILAVEVSYRRLFGAYLTAS